MRKNLLKKEEAPYQNSSPKKHQMNARLQMNGSAIGSFILTILCIFFLKITGSGVFLTLSITFGTISYHLIMRLLVGYVIEKGIKGPLNYKNAWFSPKAFEEKLYQNIKVKSWKDRAPTYKPDSFSLKKNSLEDIIQTMCISEIGHEIMILCSYFSLLFAIPFGEFWVFFLTAAAAGGVDTVFVILQRYNRPRLVKILEKRKGLAERAAIR